MKRWAFAGTPEFAAVHLRKLMTAGYIPSLVLTQPDRPAGRGHNLRSCAVAQLAQEHGLPLHQPQSLDQSSLALLREHQIQLLVVVAYGLLLPKQLLARTPAINVHASLLPRWRGAAPIEHALLAGDTETGVSLMRIVERLDAGPVMAQAKLKITGTSTGASLAAELAHLGAQTLLEHWPLLMHSQAILEDKQDHTQACYATKISKAMLELNPQQDCQQLDRQVRALGSCWFNQRGTRLLVRRARPIPDLEEGEVGALRATTDGKLYWRCANGTLELQELQLPGKASTNAPQVIQALRARDLL